MAAARHFRDLICWRLADELRVQVLSLTKRPGIARDFKFKSQFEDATGSVCRNIAEGFGCESHDEFARFLEISRRSLNEVQDCIRHALLKNYMTPDDALPLAALTKRLYPAINNLRAYLKRTPSPPGRGSRRKRYDRFMTEQEFRIKADEALEQLERSLLPLADSQGFEVESQNGVLQVVFEEPSAAKFVVSPNAPVRQIWLSALSRSYKLSWSDSTSAFELDGEPLIALVDRLSRQHLSS